MNIKEKDELSDYHEHYQALFRRQQLKVENNDVTDNDVTDNR